MKYKNLLLHKDTGFVLEVMDSDVQASSFVGYSDDKFEAIVAPIKKQKLGEPTEYVDIRVGDRQLNGTFYRWTTLITVEDC